MSVVVVLRLRFSGRHCGQGRPYEVLRYFLTLQYHCSRTAIIAIFRKIRFWLFFVPHCIYVTRYFERCSRASLAISCVLTQAQNAEARAERAAARSRAFPDSMVG